MEPGHEVETPSTDGPTPPPIRVDGWIDEGSTSHSDHVLVVATSTTTEPITPPKLTAEALLQAIAASDGSWFPSRYAADTGLPRDVLDEPLAELRLAGFIRVAEWVKSVGQGYILTPEGQIAVTNPAALEQLKNPPQVKSYLAVTRVDPSADNAEEESDQASTSTELSLRPPLVIPLLLMVNALWYFVCAVVGIRWGLTPSRSLIEGHMDVLHRFGAVSGDDLLNGEWWRLITSCFVHRGAVHLVGNLFALAMMGPLAELLWGRTRLLLIYFISGLAGSALAMALHPEASLVGASGAIWGIQMSLFAWLFAFRRQLPPDLANDWFRRLFVVFALNAALSFLPKVSWEAHLGGGVAGFLVAGLLINARFGDQRRKLSSWVMIALVPVLSVAGLALVMDAKGMSGWQRLRQRHEAMERVKKLQDAQMEFQLQVVPRLTQLSAEAMVQPEAEAKEVLKMAPRSPEQVKAVSEKIETLRSTAETIVQFTTRESSGSALFDKERERIRAFAVAREHSLDLLLKMLASPGLPQSDTWETWRIACRDANSLWSGLRLK